ncbi:hypothetical protein SAMN05421766_103706 [Zobellia uliginosa]|uniref:Uncharacterized protein n=1 Tax=Zobellia uliginosa TaxID=143224 RepID=A0ABY1KVG8_9FLAO|nr:hypothetical protein SAMN05421766_103706 [Zobellia uliginosa]
MNPVPMLMKAASMEVPLKAEAAFARKTVLGAKTI